MAVDVSKVPLPLSGVTRGDVELLHSCVLATRLLDIVPPEVDGRLKLLGDHLWARLTEDGTNVVPFQRGAA